MASLSFNLSAIANFFNQNPLSTFVVAGGVPSTTIPSWCMAYVSSGTNPGCGTSGQWCTMSTVLVNHNVI